jgi:U1 small nuclear ribonucleoprotein
MKGYAFVEFDRESGLKLAYKEAASLKLDGRRLIVDVERGRTVKGWKPKKLGGGLGKIRSGQPPKQRSLNSSRGVSSYSGPPPSYSGGSSGGFKGGRDSDRAERGNSRFDDRRPGGGSGIGYRSRGESNGPPPPRGGGYDRDRDRRSYHDRDGSKFDDRSSRYDDRRRGGNERSDRRHDDRER